MYKVRIKVEVVNEYGDVVDHRGNPAMREPITCTKEMTQWYGNVSQAHNDFNLIWAFLHPIDNIISRRG